MDRITKALNKLNQKEKSIIKKILEKVKFGNVANLDIKKLKGYNDYFRIRKGEIRIIYKLDEGGDVILINIERRSANTYKSL